MHSKLIPSFLLVFFSISLFAQEATEIYLFDLLQKDDTFVLKNHINISNNQGYDNQPSFTEDGRSILFASERNGQTDIAKYDLFDNNRSWITETQANEYSPLSYPNKIKNFTCVRLEEDGTQLLYKYSYKGKTPEVLIPNLKVGYYIWYNNKTVVSFVLGDTETLQVSNFKLKIKYPIQSNIGRSLQKIPVPMEIGDELISYISKENGASEIFAINPVTSETKYLGDALEGSNDLAWTADGTILMGKGSVIYKFKPGVDKDWIPIIMDNDLTIKNITRIVTGLNGRKLAVVASE